MQNGERCEMGIGNEMGRNSGISQGTWEFRTLRNPPLTFSHGAKLPKETFRTVRNYQRDISHTSGISHLEISHHMGISHHLEFRTAGEFRTPEGFRTKVSHLRGNFAPLRISHRVFAPGGFRTLVHFAPYVHFWPRTLKNDIFNPISKISKRNFFKANLKVSKMAIFAPRLASFKEFSIHTPGLKN